MNYDEAAARLNELLRHTQKVVVLQGDNPDGDSLSSALALEALLGKAGKDVYMYCALDIPEHLRFLDGWDRVQKDFPSSYDLAIIVDSGFWQLFNNFERKYGRGQLPPEKLVVIDEHDVDHDIVAALDIHDRAAVSSGHIIYEVFTAAGFQIDTEVAQYIASSILADTLGLTSTALVGQPRPFEIMAELVRAGLDVSELQEKRFERLKIDAETLAYKGELLQRVEYYADGRIASITIPYDEIREHSHEFNPTVILDETRLVTGVAVTIGLKQYVSAGRLVRVTGRIRCNRGFTIADELAKCFESGGGHPYAAGFKVEGSDLQFDTIKSRVIKEATRLLDEAIQHTDEKH